MNLASMRFLFGFTTVLVCVAGINSEAQAAKPVKFGKASKERLVLMPLRVAEDEKNLIGAMETALVEGLQQKYEVLSGEQVAQKAKEIFLKESRITSKKECDETRCMQDIAEAFQAELIATTNVTKRSDGYFLALSIQNIFDNKVVYSKSLPCRSCDAYQVVDKLKELSGISVHVSAEEPASINVPIITGSVNDPETALWGEVQKGNSADDYTAYLAQYPKGKYVALAKSRLNKFKNETAAELARQEQGVWDTANGAATEASYQTYLNSYPKGSYATLAAARIAKLKKDAVQAAAQGPQVGKAFRDCTDCPEMVAIPPGSFEMGSASGLDDEKPVHRVTISKAFAMGKTEVTQGQWRTVMGTSPSEFKDCGDDCPVEQVSWEEAQQYIQKLNTITGIKYRLPTEAEWEYACRAGSKKEYCGSDKVDSVAWYKDNSGNTTHPVTIKQANAFGLYDMNGNVWEWVEDIYHDSYAHDTASSGTLLSSIWSKDVERVLRGGSWKYIPKFLRSTSRNRSGSTNSSDEFGFRLARTL